MKKYILEKPAPDPRLKIMQFFYIGLFTIGIIGISALILYLLAISIPFLTVGDYNIVWYSYPSIRYIVDMSYNKNISK